MKLLGNTVLLERLLPPLKSARGIHYPHQYQDDRMQYWVLAVGPGKLLPDGTRLCPEVRVGDKCLCNVDGLGVKHKFDDGRVLVDASIIEMIWK